MIIDYTTMQQAKYFKDLKMFPYLLQACNTKGNYNLQNSGLTF